MAVWRNIGTLMVIFLAGLQSVPRRALHEAATLDGADAGSGSATSPCRCCARPCCSGRSSPASATCRLLRGAVRHDPGRPADRDPLGRPTTSTTSSASATTDTRRRRRTSCSSPSSPCRSCSSGLLGARRRGASPAGSARPRPFIDQPASTRHEVSASPPGTHIGDRTARARPLRRSSAAGLLVVVDRSVDGPVVVQDRRGDPCRPADLVAAHWTPRRQLPRPVHPARLPPLLRQLVRSSRSLVTAGNLLFCSLIGYALAKLDFPGRNQPCSWLVLGMLMVPGMVTFVPQFVLISNMGLANSYAGLVLPFLAGPFGVFLMRQFLLVDPRRPDRGRPRRRGRPLADLLAHRAAAVQARPGHARHPDVPGSLEQLPVAARGGHAPTTSTRCRSRSPSTAIGQNRIYYGLLLAGRGRRRDARAARVPGAAAALPARHRDHRTEVRGSPMRRFLVLCARSSWRLRSLPAAPAATRCAGLRRRHLAFAGPRWPTRHRSAGRQHRRRPVPATRSAYTSPTNIGGYLWSTVVARDLGIITAARGRPPGRRRR